MQSELTGRELAILQCAADGLTNRQAAGKLELLESMVHRISRSVLSKLQAENITNAVAIAIRRGLID